MKIKRLSIENYVNLLNTETEEKKITEYKIDLEQSYKNLLNKMKNENNKIIN